MNITTLKQTLRQSAGGAMFITRTQLKECLGCGNPRADEILKGLDYIKFGGDKATKRYAVDEVAHALIRWEVKP